MKYIHLKEKNDEDFSMRFVDDTDYDLLLDSDSRVFKPDGSILCVVLKNALTPENIKRAWKVLKPMNLVSRNRGVAAGRANEMLEGPTKDGYQRSGKTSQSAPGWEVKSGIVGYLERTVRMPYCRACAWNLKYPQRFAEIHPILKETSQLFSVHVPDRYKMQKEFCDRTPKEFVIPETVFTTITINKNFRTACHKDAGDLPQGFSCMSLIRQGKYLGGHLVLPAFRVAAKLDTGDLILFDPHEFHGNTQIVPLTKDAQRCTIVHYFRENMHKCLCTKEELARAKNRKEGDPLWD